MAHDPRAIANAYRVLGLEPGVSPLAARRRYRQLVKQHHPDRHAPGAQQAEATRMTQEITAAYRLIKDAAIHREVPLRRPAAAAVATPAPVSLDVETTADRLVAAFIGVVLGLFIDLALMSNSAAVWVAVPLVLGLSGAALGWRAIEAIVRAIWWLV